MLRPTAVRLAPQLSATPITPRLVARALPRPASLARTPRSFPIQARSYASESGSGSGGGGGGSGSWTQTYVILAAIAALAGGGYYAVKPVSDVAAQVKTGLDVAQTGAGQAADSISAIAKTALPPAAFALYSRMSEQEGGINGFIGRLKGQDLEGVLGEVKKVGGEDVRRVVEKVEGKVKEAKGDMTNVDWRGLAQELKKEMPESTHGTVDMLIGKIPSKEDYTEFVEKVKKEGLKKKKDIEAASSKVLEQVRAAKKDGKDQTDAFVKGIKDAAPADVDALVKQLKDTAKDAGLPADAIESWLKTTVKDGQADLDALGKQIESRLRDAARLLPVEVKDVVSQVKEFSPSLAELIESSLKKADVVDDNLEVKGKGKK